MERTHPKRRPILAAAFGVLFAASSASAAQALRIDAIHSSQYAVSDFSLTYDDINGNTIFSLNELLTFTGWGFGSLFLNTLVDVPEIVNVTEGGFVVYGIPAWEFIDSTGGGALVAADAWTYVVTPVQSVPIHGVTWVLLPLIGGIALIVKPPKK